MSILRRTTQNCASNGWRGSCLVLALLLLAVQGMADLIVDGPTTEWTPVTYGPNIPDPFNDQQTGSSEADLVGDGTHPSFYMQFDDGGTPSLTDGTIGFRVRLAEQENPTGFSTALLVGLDADMNGTLDLVLGVHNSGSSDEIAIWNSGSDSNTSPSTTSIVSPPMTSYTQVLAPAANANYDFSPVTAVNDPTATSFNVDGGSTQSNDPTDYFLSFSLPFDEVVLQLGLLPAPITFDQATPMTLVMATATQDNSLNQDLNGVEGAVNSASTWASLGVQSDLLSADGTAAQVPEPGSASLLAMAVVLLWLPKRHSFLGRSV